MKRFAPIALTLAALLVFAGTLGLPIVIAQSSKVAGVDVGVDPQERWHGRIGLLNSTGGCDVAIEYDTTNQARLTTCTDAASPATFKLSKVNLQGSDIIFALSGSGAPTDGTSGDGAGSAAPGSLYVRTSNGAIYANTNTKASPSWSQLGSVAALTDGHIFVGNGSNVGTDVAVGGDLTLANTGAFTIASNAVTSAKIATNVVQAPSAVTISAAQLRALNTTPIALTGSAPASGVARILESVVIEYVCSGCTGGATGGVISVVYHGDTTNLMNSTLPASVITGTTAGQWQFVPVATASGTPVLSAVGLDIRAATDFTGSGTGTLKVFVKYRDITL